MSGKVMHSRVKRRVILASVVCVLAGVGLSRWMQPKRMAADAFAARYTKTLGPPDQALSVYHLGHSLALLRKSVEGFMS
jgi:hypothetical protein